MALKYFVMIIGLFCLAAVTAACSSSPTPSISPSPTPTPTITTPATSYNQYQLEYLVLAKYPDFFWCDPDFYPVSREGQEQANALQQFPTIQANNLEFSAILSHLGLSAKNDYTDSEKLTIYREYKKLERALQMTASGNNYQFIIRVGQNQGQSITGTITPAGIISVISQENSFNTCPICLSRGTLIETPGGPMAVEQIQSGNLVWTLDDRGIRVAVRVLKTSATPVPDSFRMVRIKLEDGRSITASPGHPSAELKHLGDYQVGDLLDSSRIVSTEYVSYDDHFTFDLLPESDSGLYWANRILLKSTLFRNP